jgi:GNAT superfamily N-acetyltransferase
MENQILLKEPQSAPDFSAATGLILEYVKWLSEHGGPAVQAILASQNFDKEMETLPTTYGPPAGGICIAFVNDKPVAVAGIKRFSDRECEVKRMYVQPESRGLGIGKLLLTECIQIAKRLNYETIKLDTADFMESAIKLYTNNGFVEIPAYRENLHQDARYFELKL